MKYKKSDIGYVAGLFDIHGSIKILVPDTEDKEASLYLKITAKSLKLMKFLQLFGAVVGQVADGQFRAKWKDENAYKFLRLLLPHLIIKREQAEVGIEFWENKLKGVPTKDYVKPLKIRLGLLKKDDLDE